jgi:DNA-binding NtrC family response regulator
MSGSILVVDDDAHIGRSLARALASEEHDVEVLRSSTQAVEALERRSFDLLFADLVMPEMDGLTLLKRAKELRPDCVAVLMTGHPTFETVQGALRVGARDYITKPLAFDDEIWPIVCEVFGTPAARREQEPPWFEGIAAPGGPMAELLELLPRVAASREPVLISGESGTGKELVARAIHRLSERSSGPFVALNCAALNPGVLEAELFGAVRGAYSGAIRDRRGIFEAAEGGTLLLDEIAEMPRELQAKLLRVVQEGEFHRVGEPGRAVRTNARLIAATHRDLQHEVDEGRFRLDLFFRLGVLPLRTPPLRERREELPQLIDHCARSLGYEAPVEIEPDALEAILRHEWPGNIRELRNVVEQTFVFGRGSRLRLADLPAPIRTAGPGPRSPGTVVPLQTAEIRSIREAMTRTGFNQSQAARLLGITRRSLGCRIRKHGLEAEFNLCSSRVQPCLPGTTDEP